VAEVQPASRRSMAVAAMAEKILLA
jgi:hypothetical protein